MEAVRYTAKDLSALRHRFESLIPSVFPTWTGSALQVTNFGNLLFELACFTGDLMAFEQNNNAAETRIATATQRRNLLQLVKLLGYTPALAAPATVEVVLTATGLAADCTIPAGQAFKTEGEDPVEFQLTAPVRLTPSAPTATGTLEHSKTQTQTYAGTGRADQSVDLSESGFLSVVSVTGSTSGPWSQVQESAFLTAASGAKVFTVSVDNNDKATVSFGSGVVGAVPSDILTIVYRTGGGAAGNVAANSITKIDGTVLDVAGNVVDLVVGNPEGASGGADRETTESIRVRAPISIRNPTNAVSREDFEDHATTAVSGVARALMMNNDLDGTIERNSGRLFIVPTGTAPATKSKLGEVRSLFLSAPGGPRPAFPAPQTFGLEVRPAVYLDVSIRAKVYLKRSAALTPEDKVAERAAIKAAIISALVDYFGAVQADGTPNPRINFGYYLRILSGDDSITQGEIPLSDLIDVVRDVDGVFKVGAAEADFMIDGRTVVHDVSARTDTTTRVISGAHADIRLADTWFPRLRLLDGVPDVTLIDGTTNAPL